MGQLFDVTGVGDHTGGAGSATFMVAELSANHNGSLDRALETVRAAAAAGADAVKLQTYRPDTMTIDAPGDQFVVRGDGPWSGRTLYDLYEDAHTPWEWHEPLFAEARSAGMGIFSTPFDATAVELLESLGAPVYKVASFELVDDALLRTVARTGKPVILSTGMADLEEIGHAIATLREAGTTELVLLRCTSSYPAPDPAMHLRSIPELAQRFGVPVGLSDHSLGTVAPVAAVSLGACMIEKHFTLSRADGGVDSHFSVEPDEFRRLVADVRRCEQMMGTPTFGVDETQRGMAIFRRSLYVVSDVGAGQALTADNVRSIRPGYGLAPRHLAEILGRRTSRPVTRGTPVSWDLLAPEGNC